MKRLYTTIVVFYLCICIYGIVPKKSYALPAYSNSTSKHEQIIEYERYTVSYNKKHRIPNWVAWELTYNQTMGPSKGNLPFLKDESVDNCPSPTEYTNSGYSRGHMCPKADNKWDDKAYKESFYMTNVCPQKHEELNNSTWKVLEDRCRIWCKDYDKIYIVCGPIIKDYSKSRVGIGPNENIYVPNEFFKAILRVKLNKRGGVIGAESIGFLFTQEGKMKLCSVNHIENLTNFNLFHNLPSYIQEKTEVGYNKNKWNFGKLHRYL